VGIHINHLINGGLQLDLGGKHPLGRRFTDGRGYKLIHTPKMMLSLLQEYHLDKMLPFELSLFCYGECGLKELYNDYVREVEFYLQNRGSGLIKNYMTGFEGAGYEAEIGVFKGDLATFNVSDRLINSDGMKLDPKKDVYRMPDLLLRAVVMILAKERRRNTQLRFSRSSCRHTIAP
jgi:hypothetical protein